MYSTTISYRKSRAACCNKEPWIVIPKSRPNHTLVFRAAFAFHGETDCVYRRAPGINNIFVHFYGIFPPLYA